MRNESECELSECLAALCQKVGRCHSLRVDWLVKPGEQKGTTKTGLFARSDQKRGKPACGAHLALLSTGGQSFGTKRPIILTNGNRCFVSLNPCDKALQLADLAGSHAFEPVVK